MPKKIESEKKAEKEVESNKKMTKNKTTKNNTESKKVPYKKSNTKKVDGKKIENKTNKIKNTVVKKKIDTNYKIEKKIKQIKENVDEENVIEKIKHFLNKIIAMQEENLEDINKKRKDKKKNVSNEKNIPNYLLEYYDLPYRYNETVVKILAQTPKRLFVYWDVSDKDKEKYIRTFGEDFFSKTYPVLLLYNEDKKYVREIPINDFANSWYIDIQDSKNKYTIQLGRKFKSKPQIVDMSAIQEEKIILKTDYLPFADSNKLEVPNDHVLLELLPRFITFRNVKNNQETTKDLRNFKDAFGSSYNVNKFYKSEYQEELSEEGMFDMENPSSNISSSTFK